MKRLEACHICMGMEVMMDGFNNEGMQQGVSCSISRKLKADLSAQCKPGIVAFQEWVRMQGLPDHLQGLIFCYLDDK